MKTVALALAVFAVTAKVLVQGSRQTILELADQGDARAQTALGLRLLRCEGVTRDASQAAEWFRKAAGQGHSDAQLYIGTMYLQGAGVPKDRIEAAMWFREAAGQGNTAAQYNLGVMYERGEGVPQNYVAAHMWYNLAASQGLGDLSPIGNEVHAAENRDSLAQRMTAEELAEAQRVAREWKPKTHR